MKYDSKIMKRWVEVRDRIRPVTSFGHVTHHRKPQSQTLWHDKWDVIVHGALTAVNRTVSLRDGVGRIRSIRKRTRTRDHIYPRMDREWM